VTRPLLPIWSLAAPCVAAAVLAGQTPVPSHEPASRPRPAQTKPPAPLKPLPVAFVNGAPLLADRLQAAINEVMPYGVYHVGASPERVAEIRKQALDRIIDEELQYQEAKRLGLVAPKAAVDREYARVRRRYKTEADYMAQLRRSGITQADVRTEAARRALIGLAYDREVAPRCKVGESEARDYYERNESKFLMPEQLHVFTLTVGVEPAAPREQWEAARKKAEGLKAQIRSGADFEALAREQSTDPNRDKGGDLGYVHRGRLAEEFERALGDARPGALVGPVETIYGFHLLRVADVRPPVQRSFADVRERLEKDLEDRKCQESRGAWLRDLRSRATIVIPDAVPQGSAPGTPKPPVR